MLPYNCETVGILTSLRQPRNWRGSIKTDEVSSQLSNSFPVGEATFQVWSQLTTAEAASQLRDDTNPEVT